MAKGKEQINNFIDPNPREKVFALEKSIHSSFPTTAKYKIDNFNCPNKTNNTIIISNAN